MAFERAPDVSYDVVDDHVVLVDPRAVELITLNRVGSLIWQELDGEKTVPDLACALFPSIGSASAEEVERDVAAFVHDLAEAGLVVTRRAP